MAAPTPMALGHSRLKPSDCFSAVAQTISSRPAKTRGTQAVERMLRANVADYADPATPPGCMIVLAATTGTVSNESVRDFLAEQRRASEEALRLRLQQGVDDGDLPQGTDVTTLAAYVTTVQQGLSIQARDGATRTTLDAIVDHTLMVWDAMTRTLRRSPTPREGSASGSSRPRSGAAAPP